MSLHKPLIEVEPPLETIAGSTASQQLDKGLLRGLAWTSTAKWGGQIITWGSTVAIARVLLPEDYGVVGIAVVFAGLLELLTDFGLGSAVVQAKDLSDDDIEATMGATCLISLCAALVVLVGAPLWAGAYDDPRLTGIVAAMSLSVLVTGVSALPGAMLQRRLAFGEQARAQLLQGVATALITLGLAIAFRSYWALVAGLVLGKVIYAARIIQYAPVRPGSPFGNPRVKPLLHYGVILSGDRILFYFRSNFDLAFIGATMGGAQLGVYLMAATLARMPAEKLSSAVTPVAFPVFARSQGDPPAMRRHLVLLIVGVATLLLPAVAGLIATADLFVPVVIGDQWSAAILPLQIIALFTPVVFLWSLNHSILNALGHVDLNFRMTLAMTLLIPPAMLLGARWGAAGVAAAGGLAYLPVAAYGFAVTWRKLGMRRADLSAPLLPVLSATAGMAAAVIFVGSSLPAGTPEPLRLLIAILTGAVAYPLWAMGLHGSEVRRQGVELRSMWRAGAAG